MRGPQEPPQPRGMIEDCQAMTSGIMFIFHALATMHEIVWRVPGSLGRRYLGTNALIGFVCTIPLAICLFPPLYGGIWLRHLWWAQLGLVVIHRLACLRRREHIHSYEIGMSWLTRLFGMRHQTAITAGEFCGAVVAAAVAGALLCNTLAVVAVVGALANALHVQLIEARYRRSVENLLDQRLEGAEIAERARDYDL